MASTSRTVPGKNAIAVAELAFALILALDRRVPDNVAELRAGQWNKKEYSKAQGLFGKTLGLLGVGSIGQEMIRRAAGFGLDVVLWSRRFAGERRPLTEQEARELGVEAALRQVAIELAPTPEDVAARADVLSIHLALGPETKGLVNAALLERLRPGAILINTARGEVVDEAAVAAAVRDRGLRVGLDVFANEPSGATGDIRRSVDRAAGRVRHAPHRRVDRAGAGGDRGGDGPHHHHLQGDRPRAERGEPRAKRPRRRTCWSSATAIGRACSPTSSITCARPTSTSRRPRTSSSRGPKPRWRASTSTGEPSAEVCERIKTGNDNVFDFKW